MLDKNSQSPFGKSREELARRNQLATMLLPVIYLSLVFASGLSSFAASLPQPAQNLASWYGEEHRGRLMANGKRFNPDKLTAASWFYPLGTRVLVTLNSPSQKPRTVLVKITDRGPAKDLVREGRVIDLALGAFKQLARPAVGLIEVTVQPIR
jgi:rare lipoprotein A